MKSIFHADDVSPLYHSSGPNVRINEMEMSQNLIAPGMWFSIIYREGPARVIEIGTGNGGLSALLSAACEKVDAELVTMDINLNVTHSFGYGKIRHWNCFDKVDEIRSIIAQPGQTILLCDGGDKVREFNEFVGATKNGDIIAAHDAFLHGRLFWGWEEVKDDQLNLNGLERFQAYFTELSGWTVWQRVKTC